MNSKMTLIQVREFGAALGSAMDAFIANGGKIIGRSFGYGKKLCPIACLLASRSGIPFTEHISEQLSEMGFAISEKEVWSFIFTFDSGETTFCLNYPDLCQLALDLRYQYLHLPVLGPTPVRNMRLSWWQRLLNGLWRQ